MNDFTPIRIKLADAGETIPPGLFAKAGISGRVDGEDFVVEQWLSRDAVDRLLASASNRQTASYLYREITTQLERLVLAYGEADLRHWVERFVTYSDYRPLVLHDLKDSEAEFLAEFAERQEDKVSMQLRHAVAQFVTGYFSVSGNQPTKTLRKVLKLVGLFALDEVVTDILNRLKNRRWFDSDLQGEKTGHFAVRVLADFGDHRCLQMLEQMLEDPSTAAACYQGLVAVNAQNRERLFLKAARAAVRGSQVGALRSICITYLSASSELLFAGLADTVHVLVNAGSEVEKQIGLALIEAVKFWPGAMHALFEEPGDLIDPYYGPGTKPSLDQSDCGRVVIGHDASSESKTVIIPAALIKTVRRYLPPEYPDPRLTMEQLLDDMDLDDMDLGAAA